MVMFFLELITDFFFYDLIIVTFVVMVVGSTELVAAQAGADLTALHSA